MGPDSVEIDFDEIVRETDMAVLFTIDGDEYWLPRSKIDVDVSEHKLTLPEWLAIEKRLV